MGASGPKLPAPGGEWLPRVIGAIGESGFPAVLFEALNEGFGVDHIVVATLRRRGRTGTMATVGRIAPQIAERLARDYTEADWFSRDPNLSLVFSTGLEAQTVSPTIVPARYTREYRKRFFEAPNIVDKVALSIRVEDDCWLYANFHRLADSGPFGEAERAALVQHGSVLASALARHRQLVERARFLDVSGPAFKALTPREREVCAAILSGLTLHGVAASLGISFNTVLTLRRRAYARLGIGTERELIRLSLKHG